MEATITRPHSGLEHRDGLHAARMAQAEAAALGLDNIKDELEADLGKAMRGEQQFVPGLVGNAHGEREALTAAVEIVVSLIANDLTLDQFREVLNGSHCPRVTTLRAFITSRLFRDLTESVQSALNWVEVAHQLMTVLRESTCGTVHEFREQLADAYVDLYAERIAKVRGVL